MPTLSKYYIGVDPGNSGGIVVIRNGKMDRSYQSFTDHSLWDFMKSLGKDACKSGGAFATLEKVSGYVGGAGNTGASMFSFGRSYGALRMALIAAGIPFEEIVPGVWQKALGIPKRKPHTKTVDHVITKGKNKGKKVKKKVGGETTNEWKNRLRAEAMKLFPNDTITLATADAALIAEYCRRKREGEL